MASIGSTSRPQPLAGIASEIGSWSLSLKIGTAMMLLIALSAIFAPWVAPYDPNFQDFGSVLLPPGFAHLFGTDSLGRDVFSRVIHGARIDLQIGVITTYVPMIYGVMLGAYSGYLGGRFDAVLMRVLDVAMAFPFLVLIIVILAILGPGVQNIYISVFLVAWTMYARLARAEMMVERGKDYITAARVLGFPTNRIILRHGLPNVINSSIVFSMSDFVLNILLVSGLSFLGLGIQPPIPEWGAMIAEGRDFILQAWWICTLPGLAIVFTGTTLSLIGDGLARRLGERHHTFV
ncbi:peptide ABC transporter permease [Hypericibacter terrae]|uniref:Peptide ABC transporter permease n=1 Tax=Hypericibacter terrae TaxID=2602015 RepID=A0A5J6MFK1_9PROT|nr:ABC transporter permease [Hypericibacter terrae]QEX15020.1 peptide ABC transporter permease [Hypericibacter terrae]